MFSWNNLVDCTYDPSICGMEQGVKPADERLTTIQMTQFFEIAYLQNYLEEFSPEHERQHQVEIPTHVTCIYIRIVFEITT